MIYGSVCSGIEAASEAWKPLGWKASFLSEIADHPRTVLKHHHPEVPLRGDFTEIQRGDHDAIDILVGGTPCQSFSIAGLRGGLADDRGNLALEYLKLAQRLRPRWLVWENVPGVLSSNGGRDLGTFLGALAELGYGWAYRVLDAQFIQTRRFGGAVPQRRARVILVGYLGDWRRAAAVLPDRESLSGHPAPRRKAGQSVAPTISARPTGGGGLGTDFDLDGGLLPQAFGGGNCSGPIEAAACLVAKGQRIDFEVETFVAHAIGNDDHAIAIQERAVSENMDAGPGGKGFSTDGAAYTLEARGKVQAVAHALRGEGHDAGEDGTGRGTPIIPVSFDCKGTEVQFRQDGAANTLRSMGHANSHANSGGHEAVAFAQNQRDEVRTMRVAGALAAEPGVKQQTYIAHDWAVRRLTPLECERLQAFRDGHTLVPTDRARTIQADMARYLTAQGAEVWFDNRGRWRTSAMADGPRYKMLGNSMAVNVMGLVGERIEAVERMEL